MMMEGLSKKDNLALEIDLRMLDVYALLKDQMDEEELFSILRFAYGAGYAHAIRDRGKLLRDTGYKA